MWLNSGPAKLGPEYYTDRFTNRALSVGGDLTAVDVDGLAADPVAFLGAEEDDGAGDVGSGAGAAHGDVRL